MKIKLFEGTDVEDIESRINAWITSSGATLVDAKISKGHPYSYVVLIRYDEYVDNTTYVANYVTPTNTNWQD